MGDREFVKLTQEELDRLRSVPSVRRYWLAVRAAAQKRTGKWDGDDEVKPIPGSDSWPDDPPDWFLEKFANGMV